VDDVISREPQAAIVLLAAHCTDAQLAAALEAGVRGLVRKSEPFANLAVGLRGTVAGEVVIPPKLLRNVISWQQRRESERSARSEVLERLTKRETEVLVLVSKGLDSRTIAARLGVSVATVRGHVQRILGKLGVHSKLEAVVRFAERELSIDQAL
jgi:DNA-binding NarL/FixJ family response regulator